MVETKKREYQTWRLISLSTLSFSTNYSLSALSAILLPKIIADVAGNRASLYLGVIVGLGELITSLLSLVIGYLSDLPSTICFPKVGKRAPFYITGVLIIIISLLCFGAISTSYSFFFLSISMISENNGDNQNNNNDNINYETSTTYINYNTSIINKYTSIIDQTSKYDISETQASSIDDSISSSVTSTISVLIIGGLFLMCHVGSGISSPSYAAMIPELVPANQLGAISGYSAFGMLIGGLFAFLFTGYLLHLFGYFIVCLMCSFVLFFCLVVTFSANREVLIFRDDNTDNQDGEDVDQLTSTTTVDLLVNNEETTGGIEEPIFDDEFVDPIITTINSNQLHNLNNINEIWRRIIEVYREWQKTGFIWALFTRVVFNFGLAIIQNYALYEVESMAQPYRILYYWEIDDPLIATSLYVSLLYVFSIVCAVPGGYLGDRFGLRFLVILSSFLTSFSGVMVGVGIFLQFPFGINLVVAAIYGIGLGCYMSVDAALIMRCVPVGRYGSDIAISTFATTIPNSIAPFFAAIFLTLLQNYLKFSDATSYTLLFFISSAVMFTATFFMLKVPKSVDIHTATSLKEITLEDVLSTDNSNS